MTENEALSGIESYRILFDSMNESLIIGELIGGAPGAPADLRILGANRAFLRRVGRSPAQVIGHTLRELTGDLFQERWLDLCERALHTGGPIRSDEHLSDPELWFRIVLCGLGGRRIGALVADITAHKKTEDDLRACEDRYRGLFMNLPVGIILHQMVRDSQDRIVDWVLVDANPAALREMNLAREEAVGKKATETFSPQEVAAGIEWSREVIETGLGREKKVYMRLNGQHYLSCKFPLGKDLVATSNVNITELMRAEEALRESERRARALAEELRTADRCKDEFMMVLSHELRNPLAAIQNGLHLLEHAAPGSDQAKRSTELIRRQFDHLTRLVDDLLDLTRITQHKIQLDRRRLELGDFIRRMLEDYQPLFQTGGLRLLSSIPPASIFIHADAARLAQTIGNLLQNAAKFTPRGGEVHVGVESDPSGKRAVIRVKDTGIGIPPEVLPRLCQPFMQVETALDRRGGGLGLGLAVSKGLIELHGGEISVTSAGRGQGAEFAVSIPLAGDSDAEPQVEREEIPPARRRILIIEDHADLAESLRELLEIDGHEVEIARSGPEGLAKARDYRPEVVLCDIGLPGMDGYGVARAIRADASLKEAVLVAMTGYAFLQDIQRALAAGFDEHLPKPPDMAALNRVVAGKKGRLAADASRQGRDCGT